MISAALYQELVPDAPGHRRIDGDPPKPAFWSTRMKTNAIVVFQPKPIQQPELISTFRGKIEKLLFAFPSFATSEPAYVGAYKSVFSALRPGTSFIIIHHPDGKAKIESWLVDAGHDANAATLIELPSYVSFTDWAEDGYVSIRDAASGTHHLVEPWEFKRAGDALIADAVESETDVVANQAPLIFQGGNCLITDSHWLIGKDYFIDSIKLISDDRPPVVASQGKTADQFVVELFHDYVDSDRDLIVVGTDKPLPLIDMKAAVEDDQFFLDLPTGGAGTFQPIFHIDMFLTPLSEGASGKLRFLVGDPNLADMLLGTKSPYALSDVYDKIAGDLASAGFEVVRNPLVHRSTLGQQFTLKQLIDLAAKPGNDDLVAIVKDFRSHGASNQNIIRVRNWHHITWNNCLVEHSVSVGDHVYLPTFGYGEYADLAAIDQHMDDLWKSFGFTTHMLGDFNTFAERMGVVHCIKKYISRGD